MFRMLCRITQSSDAIHIATLSSLTPRLVADGFPVSNKVSFRASIVTAKVDLVIGLRLGLVLVLEFGLGLGLEFNLNTIIYCKVSILAL